MSVVVPDKPRGLFIVIEGTDRCGKSTQVKKLLEHIGNNKCEEMCFPDRNTKIGKVINDILVNTTMNDEPMNHQALHLLFSSNRWEKNDHMERILMDSRDIVCSRYFYSGAAYSMAKGLKYDWCIRPERGLVYPDIVFHLKMKNSKELVNREGFGKELYEQEEFQQKVSDSFDVVLKEEMDYWKYDNCGPMFVEIDATLPIEEITSKIIKIYELEKKKK